MRAGQQIVCVYEGHPRELCPIILGHSLKGDEKALGPRNVANHKTE